MHWLRELGALGPLAAVSVVVPPIAGLLVLGTLTTVGPWLREHQAAGLAVYVGGFVLLGSFGLLPTYAQSVLGGWAFGFASGTAAALVGFTGAAALAYAVARVAAGNRIVDLVAGHARWHGVYRALLHSEFWRALLIITLLRVPPNAPYAATNLTLGALAVPFTPYVLGTLIGLAPRTAAIVYAASELSTLDFSDQRQRGMFLASLVVTVGVLAALGWMATQALRRVEALGSEPQG